MKKALNVKTIIIFILLLVLGASVASTAYFYNEYQKIKNNPDILAQEETKTVTDAIKKFMELPTDEEPTIATVTDSEKLKDQDFFKNSQNGDKIVIYTNARKAIIYRPSTNKIIEFAPLLIGDQNGTTDQQQTQAEPIKIAIYNGTNVAGLTAEYEAKFKDVSNISITDKTNATKRDYTKTLVIDISGKYKDTLAQVAQLVGGEVATALPEGEAKPNADILVIAGK